MKAFWSFIEALLAAMRTCSALLMGNSVLVYFGVIGNPKQALPIALVGITVLLFSCYPWTNLKRN